MDKKIIEELEEIIAGDPYGLSIQTLISNIKNSTGTYEKLAEIFAVPIHIIKVIKEEK